MSANALSLLLMVVISWPVAAPVAGDPLMAALGIVAGRGGGARLVSVHHIGSLPPQADNAGTADGRLESAGGAPLSSQAMLS